MARYTVVEDLPAAGFQKDDEYIEDAETGRDHSEKITGDST